MYIQDISLASLLPEVYIYMIVSIHTYLGTDINVDAELVSGGGWISGRRRDRRARQDKRVRHDKSQVGGRCIISTNTKLNPLQKLMVDACNRCRRGMR